MLLLDLNQIEVTPFLVTLLEVDLYFMEHKLKLIEKFLDVMDTNTMLMLLEQLNTMNEIKDINTYFAIYNTHPAMICTLMFRLTQRIGNYMPKYANRIKEIQQSITHNAEQLLNALNENSQTFFDTLKVKDKDGESMFTHFIETK